MENSFQEKPLTVDREPEIRMSNFRLNHNVRVSDGKTYVLQNVEWGPKNKNGVWHPIATLAPLEKIDGKTINIVDSKGEKLKLNGIPIGQLKGLEDDDLDGPLKYIVFRTTDGIVDPKTSNLPTPPEKELK